MDEIRMELEMNEFNIDEKIVYIKEHLQEVLDTYFPGTEGLYNDDIIARILSYFIYINVENPLMRQNAGQLPEYSDIKNAISELLAQTPAWGQRPQWTGRQAYPDRFGIFNEQGRNSHFLHFARNELDRFNQEQLTLARERLSMATGTVNLADAEDVGEDVSRRILGELGGIPQQQINRALIEGRPLREAEERIRRARLARELAYASHIQPELLLREVERQPHTQWPTHQIPGQGVAPRGRAATCPQPPGEPLAMAVDSPRSLRSNPSTPHSFRVLSGSDSSLDLGSVDGGGKKKKRTKKKYKKKLINYLSFFFVFISIYSSRLMLCSSSISSSMNSILSSSFTQAPTSSEKSFVTFPLE